MSEENGQGIFDSCVMLSFTVHVIGNSAKGNMEEIETTADKSMLKLSKTLLDCEEYKTLSKIAAAIRTKVKQKCFGGDTEKYKTKDGEERVAGVALQSLVKSGCYLTPLAMVTTVENIIEENRPLFYEAVNRFCDVYYEKQEEAKQRLGRQYNPSNYYSLKEVKQKCYMDHKYLSIGVPASLKSIKEELFESEKKKAAAMWAEASQEIDMVLQVGLKSLIDHAVDRLKPGEDGKKKKFNYTMVEKIKEFLVDFPAKNITNNNQLSQLVSQLRGLMEGKTAENLREDEGMRERVLKRMQVVKDELDSMVENAPSRAILLE